MHKMGGGGIGRGRGFGRVLGLGGGAPKSIIMVHLSPSLNLEINGRHLCKTQIHDTKNMRASFIELRMHAECT